MLLGPDSDVELSSQGCKRERTALCVLKMKRPSPASALASCALVCASSLALGCHPCEDPIGLELLLMTNPTTASLRAVTSSGGMRAVAVGDSGAVVTYAAESWTVQNSGVNSNLYGITSSRDEPGLIIAVGADGTVLRSEDGGFQWMEVDSGVGADLHAVEFTRTPLGVVAVGDRAIVRSDDLGITWMDVSPSALSGILRAVRTLSSEVLTVGEAGQGFISSDDGFSWHPIDLGTSVDLFGVGLECVGPSDACDFLVAGAGGTVRVRRTWLYGDGRWRTGDVSFTADFVGVSEYGEWMVATNGVVYNAGSRERIVAQDEYRRAIPLLALTDLPYEGEEGGIAVLVGEGGRIARVSHTVLCTARD